MARNSDKVAIFGSAKMRKLQEKARVNASMCGAQLPSKRRASATTWQSCGPRANQCANQCADRPKGHRAPSERSADRCDHELEHPKGRYACNLYPLNSTTSLARADILRACAQPHTRSGWLVHRPGAASSEAAERMYADTTLGSLVQAPALGMTCRGNARCPQTEEAPQEKNN